MSSSTIQYTQTRQIDGCLTPVGENPYLKHSSIPMLEPFARESNSRASKPVDAIPSPPLSPHTRVSNEDTNQFMNLLFPKASRPQLKSNLLTQDAERRKGIGSVPSPEPTSYLADVKSEKPRASFPLKDMAHSSLYINPFHDIGKPGFKRRQLSFLSHYHLSPALPQIPEDPTESSSPKKYSSSSKHYTSSGIRASYNTVPKSRSEKRHLSPNFETRKSKRHLRHVRSFEQESGFDTSNSDSSAPVSPPPKKKRRRRRPTTRKANSATTRYDYDYTKLPNFCPSIDVLPDNARCMKTEWKGQSMDLDDDPLIKELHPAEIVLASTLRLPCKVYLDSKRRIFSEKVHRMKQHLPFRRTDAQKACKIDVNKASRLYVAFEKVGWLRESNFKKYM